jgi:prevent-host-death family protein
MIQEVHMTLTINVYEAKTHLSELLERVMNGEQIVIAKAGKPVAVLSPVVQTPAQRIPGIDAGKVLIGPDFDAPLPEFDL